MGHAIAEAKVWRSRLASVSKAAKYMGDIVPKITADLSKLDDLGHDPSAGLCELLTSMFTDLPADRTTLSEVYMEEYEALAFPPANSSATNLIAAVEKDEHCEEAAMLAKYKSLFQFIDESVPMQADTRRLLEHIVALAEKKTLKVRTSG